MRIQSLNVRGAIGFKKNMGVDEINVDLSNLSGMVALAGPNGHGKTTFLESLSPFRTFASREGALRHHFFLRDSFRKLTFEYGGDFYRTLVKIDADSDRTEGFIWKNGVPQVDGKVTNYNEYINSLLGSANLFYNSVFCAQNASKLSDMTNSQLKNLFVEFLRLDRLARYESTAKQCINVLRGSCQHMDKNIASLQERINKFQSLENELAQAVKDKDRAVEMMDEASILIKQYKAMIENFKDIEAKNSVNIERRDDLKKDIKSLKDEMEKSYRDELEEKKKNSCEIDKKTSELRSYQAVLEDREAISKAADAIKSLDNEITKARSYYDTAGKTLENLYKNERSAIDEIQSLYGKIREIKDSKARVDMDCEVDLINKSMSDTQSSIKQLSLEKTEAEQSFKLVQLDSDIKACKDSMALLDKRDQECTSMTCSFISSALDAKKRVVELEAEKQALLQSIEKKIQGIDDNISAYKSTYSKLFEDLKDAAFRYNELRRSDEKKTAEITAEISKKEVLLTRLKGSITNTQKSRDENQKIIDGLLLDLEEHRAMADRLPELQKADTMAEQMEKEISSLEATIKEKRDQYHSYDIQARSKLLSMSQRLDKIKASIDEDISKKLSDAEAFLASREAQKDELSKKVKSADERMAVLKQRMEEKEAVEQEMSSANKEFERITEEASQWEYLKHACGKTGLQALEIDGVAPLITGYANDLLTSSFGPNFSVKLITQDPETGKEVIDIIVIRGDGSETKLENLSGGEKVWVLKALRLAMTLVSKEKSGRNFQTILCDEEDGPLDTEKAVSFAGLYKSILEVGGFDSCFYISHNQDVIGMADHRIEFSRGGISIC